MKSQNLISHYNEFSKTKKTIFVLAILVTTFTAVDFLIQFIDAASVSIALSEGVILSLRDTNDSRTEVTISGTVNLSTNELAISVTDPDANISPLAADVVSASATSTTSGTDSATATLTETRINSGIFTTLPSDIITLSSSSSSGSNLETGSGDQFRIFYPSLSSELDDPAEDSEPNARVKATFTGTSGSGDVVMTDFVVTTAADIECPAIVFLDPVDVTFTGSADATSIEITLSYANANLGANDPRKVQVLFRDPATSVYESLTPPQVPDPHPQGFRDLSGHAEFSASGSNIGGAKTITNIDQPSTASVAGRYTLGIIDGGCSGGGGGGLVRPGLVVNALAGLSAVGGGGGGPPGPTITLGAVAKYDSASETISMPQEIRDIVNNHDPYTPLEPITDIYEDFDLPLSINGNGFALGGYENTLVTQTIEPGEPTEFNIVFYTNSEIAHTSLYFNLGPTRAITGSDTQILLYKDKPVEIIDPNGNIASATGSINNEGDLKRVVTFSITFSEDIQWSNSDLVIRSWNDQLSSGDTIIYDAIEVVSSSQIVEVVEEDLPEPEIQTLKSQHVPIWIKNNAAWWSQELIEDSDFVAGIEYLIQNEIITIQDNQVIASSYSSNEIPEWIKNNAGWWSEDLITEKEFIDGLQWLISNGIIQVQET